MIDRDYINDIRLAVPTPACFELLAEECTELAHAALKWARVLRGENPAAADLHEIACQLAEEASDVHLVCKVLDIKPDPVIVREKLERWHKRIEGRPICAKSGDTSPYGGSDALNAGRK